MVAEPITGKEILTNDHSTSHNDGIGNTQIAITGKAIAAEDGTADNGLEQIVGKTHATEDTEVMKHTPNTLESVPGRNYCRDDHQQYDKAVNRLQPGVKFTEIHETQRWDYDSRAKENVMPDLQMSALIVKEPLTPQLHAEDEEAE